MIFLPGIYRYTYYVFIYIFARQRKQRQEIAGIFLRALMIQWLLRLPLHQIFDHGHDNMNKKGRITSVKKSLHENYLFRDIINYKNVGT